MASFVDDVNEKVKDVLVKALTEVDEEIIDYLTGVCCEADDIGEKGEGLVELLSPFLESYGAAGDDEESEKLAQEIVDSFVCNGILVLNKEEPSRKKNLQLRKEPICLANEDMVNDWGLKMLPNQDNSNVFANSISEALGSKRALAKMKKREEKEKRKEELKYEREERERLRIQAEEDAYVEPDPNDKSMSTSGGRDVIIPNFTMYIGAGQCLLEDSQLKIVHGRKYGLIGRNGVGKTTLLKHISRRKIEKFPTHLSVLHVEQEVVGDDTKVIDSILAADKEREHLLKEEQRILYLLDNPSDNKDKGEDLNESLKQVYENLGAIQADSAEARARLILNGLGFPAEYQEAATKSLSGGWRMRVALGQALFVAPDILMLDEPTNHLDLEACVWLERYLAKYPKTLMLVSHDRKFTNNVITDVIHFENKKLNYYKGDIDVFEQTRANQRLQQQREYESQQNKKEHMQKFIDKFRFNAKRASLVQSRIKALGKLSNIEEVIDDPEFTFTFPEPISELNKLIEVQDVSFGYPPKNPGDPVKLLFTNVEFSIHQDSRIAILGPNGCGKSTLLNLILDKMSPVSGYIQRDTKLRIAHFAQHHIESLNLRMSPLENLLNMFEGSKPDKVRSHLARYGIPASLAEQKIRTMSGGQKSRVAFAVVTWYCPHVLILDEPTNHLDLETVEALILAVSTFEGAVAFVSHDQHFIEKCTEEFWVINDQKLTRFKGDFDEYKKWAMPDEDKK